MSYTVNTAHWKPETFCDRAARFKNEGAQLS